MLTTKREDLLKQRQQAFERIENDYYDSTSNVYKNNIIYRERVVAINKKFDDLLHELRGCSPILNEGDGETNEQGKIVG